MVLGQSLTLFVLKKCIFRSSRMCSSCVHTFTFFKISSFCHEISQNSNFFSPGDYAGFDVNRLTSKNRGKAEVACFLKNKFGYEKLVMVGDGSIDADASPPADAFIGNVGNTALELLPHSANIFLYHLFRMILSTHPAIFLRLIFLSVYLCDLRLFIFFL